MSELYRVEIRDNGGSLKAILENAFDVGYEAAFNQVGTAWFSLPADDSKALEVQLGREVWLYEQASLVDVYRIARRETRRQGTELVEQVSCEQAGACLLDDVIPFRDWQNQAVATILQEILGYQSSPRISYGGVDSGLNQSRSLRAEWDTLLEACLNVQKSVGGVLLILPDPVTPTIRKLYLKETWNVGEDKGQQLRYGKNLAESSRSIDLKGLVTKLYPLGYGEGENQLRLSWLVVQDEQATKSSDATYGYLTLGGEYSCYDGYTGLGSALPAGMVVKKNGVDDSANWSQGPTDQKLRCPIAVFDPAATYTIAYRHADYLKADTWETWGIVSAPWVDREQLFFDSLIQGGRVALGRLKNPKLSYSIKAIDLARLGPEWSFEKLSLGNRVKVIDEELGISIQEYVVRLHKGNLADPVDFEIELSNKVADLGDALASLGDRQGGWERHTTSQIGTEQVTLEGEDRTKLASWQHVSDLKKIDGARVYFGTIDTEQLATMAVQFQNLGDEVRAGIGREWFGCFYEAESLPGGTGSVVVDPSASGGSCRKALSTDPAGHLIYGPYLATLAAGNHWVLFRLKVASNASQSQVATLDINSSRGVLASRVIKASDFYQANVWQSFALLAEVREDDASLEFRAYFHPGATDLSCDFVRAIPLGLVSTEVIENLAVTNAKIADAAVGTLKVADGAIIAGKMNIISHILDGVAWADNSPSPGYVSWSGAKVVYKGATYNIANGSTNLKYIWWDYTYPNSFQASATKPALADDDFLVCLNLDGAHLQVWAGTLVHGGTIRTGSISTEELQAGSVTAEKVNILGLDASGRLILTQIGSGTLDDIPEGAVYGKVRIGALTNGQVDLGKADVINKVADNIAESAARKWAAETGADITANHEAAQAQKLTQNQYLDEFGIEIASSSGPTRVVMSQYRIAGYNAGSLQFELRASDGRAYAGGGSVILDAEGISINGTLKLITFKPTEDWSFIYGASDGFLHIETPELQVHGDMYFDGLDLRTYVGFGYYSRIGPDSDSSAYTFFRTLNIAGTWNVDHKLCPTAGAWGYLGDATYYWYKSYIAYAYFLDVLPKNGPDTGSVGNPTDYWFNGYFNHLRYKDLGSFQEHDDLALIRRLRPDPVRQGLVDRASVPAEIRGRPDPEAVTRHRDAMLRDAQNEAARILAEPERKKDVTEAERTLLRAEAKKRSDEILAQAQKRAAGLDGQADEGIDVGASIGLAFGAIRQLADRLEALERANAERG